MFSSPWQPNVLLAKLDGKGRGIDDSLLSLNCDHIVCPGEEVVVSGDDIGQEQDETGWKHPGWLPPPVSTDRHSIKLPSWAFQSFPKTVSASRGAWQLTGGWWVTSSGPTVATRLWPTWTPSHHQQTSFYEKQRLRRTDWQREWQWWNISCFLFKRFHLHLTRLFSAHPSLPWG